MQIQILLQYLLNLSIILISVLALLALWLVAVQSTRVYTTKVPVALPWVGLQGNFVLARLRATFREFGAKRRPIEEGWEKYGRHKQSFVLPSLKGPEVVLPPSHTRWMNNQPEHVLGVEKVQDHLLALPYLAHGPDGKARHDFSVIQRDLTRHLGKLSSSILAEVESVLTDEFGTNTGWTEVRPSHVAVQVAQHVASRVFVGAEISRNRLFHTLLDNWAFAFGYIGLLLRTSVPAPLFPIIATPLFYFVTLRKRKVAKVLVPVIEQRISQVLEAQQEKLSTERSDSNLDVLQWLIKDAVTASDPRLLDPWNITGKVMLFHLFAEHTTAKTSATVIFDLLSYTNASDVLDQLRAEAEEFLPQVWTDPYCIRKMVKLDSAIRESMRLNPMCGHALTREVIPAEGITTPDGLQLPQGCRIAADVSNMQREFGIDEDGSCYEPLRYFNAANSNLLVKQRNSTHISGDFLTFSLGKHACPGRFFAAHVLKLMLGYMIMNYDLEPLQTRPEFLEFGDLALPPSEAVIRVRKRVGTV